MRHATAGLITAIRAGHQPSAGGGGLNRRGMKPRHARNPDGPHAFRRDDAAAPAQNAPKTIPQQASARTFAVKLLRSDAMQAEALQRYRGKGQQRVTVE